MKIRKTMEFQQNTNTTNHYFETNNSHLIVDTTSPFHRDSKKKKCMSSIDKNDSIGHTNKDSIDVFRINSTFLSAPTSSNLVDEIIKDCEVNTNDFIYTGLIGHHTDTMPQANSISSNNIYNIASCSKDVSKCVNFNPKAIYINENNDSYKQKYIQSYLNVSTSATEEKKYAEKMTYCRPILNLYNQQFIHKIMQRNAKLQKLVEKMVLARQREKRDAWNNYINQLKNKHRNKSSQSMRIFHNGVIDGPELIDDYYNMQYVYEKPNPHAIFSHDFYGNIQTTAHDDYTNNYEDIFQCYDSNQYCYPMSSQGRFNMLQKERIKQKNDFAHELQPRPPIRAFRNGTIIAEREFKKRRNRYIKSDIKLQTIPKLESETTLESQPKPLSEFIPDSVKSSKPTRVSVPKSILESVTEPMDIRIHESDLEEDVENEISTKHKCVQTEDHFCCLRSSCSGAYVEVSTTQNKDVSIREEYQKVSNNVTELKKKIQAEEHQSLSGIEKKLDTLIKSIHMFVSEMKLKSKNAMRKKSKDTVVCECIHNETNSGSEQIHISSSRMSTTEPVKEEQVFYGMENCTRNAFTFSGVKPNLETDSLSKIDKILNEEMDKSNKIKRDIESLLNLRNEQPCSVHITFDIPTRERSTEVTNSLSKTRVETVSTDEEITPSKSSHSRNHMTIAVNTDPLGLLALLRVSTETVKQILSYVPNIDCYSYLSMLQFSQLSKNYVSHYICNICGAAFGQPSQLSDHIQEHNLGKARDCCVCRHALDMQSKRFGLYPCQYCGQRFTRAYCCELHQESCARGFGRKHDVATSLMLLK